MVGALLLSVALPLVLAPLSLTDTSSEFFGPTAITTFTYVYRALVSFTAVESLLLVLGSSRAYLQLSVWMPTLELKIWWCTHISIVTYASSCILVVHWACLSIPFGVAVNVSPGMGRVALVAVVYAFVKVTRLTRNDCLAVGKLHWYACQVCSNNKS